jgi:hypothetical protein
MKVVTRIDNFINNAHVDREKIMQGLHPYHNGTQEQPSFAGKLKTLYQQ